MGKGGMRWGMMLIVVVVYVGGEGRGGGAGGNGCGRETILVRMKGMKQTDYEGRKRKRTSSFPPDFPSSY